MKKDPEQIAIGIEVNHGAVVEALLAKGLHPYSINPKLLDRLRDRFSPAGSKDDRRDAFVLALCVLPPDPDGCKDLGARREDAGD